MKNRLMQLAAGLALMAVLGKFYAVPLIAQVRAAVVKNIDEHGRVPYQQGSQCSVGPGGCDVIFAMVPPNKRLVVETISALAEITPGNVEVTESFLSDGSTNGPGFFPARLYLAPINSGNIGNFGVRYHFFGKADLFLEAGSTPKFRVSLFGSNTMTLSATLTGYLVDLTQ
jgi:hypothetical protein